jgi:hypothetical protein
MHLSQVRVCTKSPLSFTTAIALENEETSEARRRFSIDSQRTVVEQENKRRLEEAVAALNLPKPLPRAICADLQPHRLEN